MYNRYAPKILISGIKLSKALIISHKQRNGWQFFGLNRMFFNWMWSNLSLDSSIQYLALFAFKDTSISSKLYIFDGRINDFFIPDIYNSWYHTISIPYVDYVFCTAPLLFICKFVCYFEYSSRYHSGFFKAISSRVRVRAWKKRLPISGGFRAARYMKMFLGPISSSFKPLEKAFHCTEKSRVPSEFFSKLHETWPYVSQIIHIFWAESLLACKRASYCFTR